MGHSVADEQREINFLVGSQDVQWFQNGVWCMVLFILFCIPFLWKKIVSDIYDVWALIICTLELNSDQLRRIHSSKLCRYLCVTLMDDFVTRVSNVISGHASSTFAYKLFV